MSKDEIIRKLTSRKFWAAVIGFVSALLVAFGVKDADITQIVGVITAGATLIAYIVGEGMVDVARAGKEAEKDGKNDHSEGN